MEKSTNIQVQLQAPWTGPPDPKLEDSICCFCETWISLFGNAHLFLRSSMKLENLYSYLSFKLFNS